MRPVIRVLAGGSPVNGIFYSRLISCGIRDESGQESDTLECTFDWRGYAIALPNEGAILEPLFGYAGGALTSMGKFVVDGYTSAGGPDGLLLSGCFSGAFQGGQPNIFLQLLEIPGGRTGARTPDPLIKSQLLYQLSYAPPRVTVAL